MRRFFIPLFIFITTVLCHSAVSETYQGLIRQLERPNIQAVAALEDPLNVPRCQNEVSPSLQMYVAAAQIVLKLLPDHKVFLMARDMDEFGDFVDYYLAQRPGTEKLKANLFRLPISREVARSSSMHQLRPWMLKHGLDIEALKRGKEKVAFVDIGWVGQIYKKLLISTMMDAQYDRDFSMQFALNILNNSRFFLMASHGPPTIQNLRSALQSGEVKTLSGFFQWVQRKDFIFENLFDSDPAVANRLFNVSSYNDRLNFVWKRAKIHFRHWRGRGTKLDEDGTELIDYDGYNAADAEVNRPEVVARLEQMRQHIDFNNTGELGELNNVLKSLVKVPVEILPLSEADPEKLEVGQRFEVRPGLQIELLQLVHTGESARVFKARQIDGDTLFALKVPLHNDAESMAALDRSVKRLEKMKQNSIPHSELIFAEAKFILKEWIEGTTGKDWLASLNADENLQNSEQFVSLARFFRERAQTGTYIRNVSPSNVVYGKAFHLSLPTWRLIDSSSIQLDDDIDANIKWQEAFHKYWKPIAPQLCEALLTERQNQ